MDLYAETILDHYRNPRFKQERGDATITHAEKNLSCGDTLTIYLTTDDVDHAELNWTGDGCAISQAGMSILAEAMQEKTLTELEALNAADVRELLGIPVGNRRIKCALLCLHTLKNTLHTLHGESLQSWTETVGNDEKTS
jgi:nitrogen fixation NifU-like protein